MPRKSDYAARVARAQAAGYSSLSAQRTAQAHARGFTSRAAEIAAAKQPEVDKTIQHMRDIGINIKAGGQENRLRKSLSRQTYRKLAAKQNISSFEEWRQEINDGDKSYFYH